MNEPMMLPTFRVTEIKATGVELTDDRVICPGGDIPCADLDNPQPNHKARLAGVSPMIERLWRVALADVESNIITTPQGMWFGGGRSFGPTVFTRDIAYSGLLGLNRLYPQIMRQSLDFAVRQRLAMGYTAPRQYHVDAIDAPWNLVDLDDGEFLAEYGTSSFLRRTDDVVWLWAAHDLLESESADLDAWRWMYEMGQRSFDELYTPMLDPFDGLYRGQASFIDIHFAHKKSAGYPLEWTIADCLLQQTTSTNALYVRGMQAMSAAAVKLGLPADSAAWSRRADALREAMMERLRHRSGSWAFYIDAQGELSPRREALGAALVVLLNIVQGDEAVAALRGYPVTDHGVPTFWPFFDDERCYHNNTSWPFVEAFFLQAWERAFGEDTKPLTLAMLARTCVDDGTFHEVVDFRTGRAGWSASQLWTAAAFLGTCLRSGFEVVGAAST
jgi:hypothetical protein